MTTGAFSRNVDKLFFELKLVIHYLLLRLAPRPFINKQNKRPGNLSGFKLLTSTALELAVPIKFQNVSCDSPPTASHTQTSILTARKSPQHRPECPAKESSAQKRLLPNNKPPRRTGRQRVCGRWYVGSPIPLVSVMITPPIWSHPNFLSN